MVGVSKSEHPTAAMEDVSVMFDEGRVEVKVNSAVLMLASPVFHSMLTQTMKESETKQIELPDKDPEEFKVLMSFLIPPTARLQRISVENVDFLLVWSDEYCIDPLKSECLEFIQTQPASIQRVLQAYAFDLHEYLDQCIRELLAAKTEDWSPCYGEQKLVQQIMESAVKLLMSHVHKEGKLDFGHHLQCIKCSRAYNAGWQCSQCKYK